VFDDHVEDVLKEVCLEISLRYQMKFLKIGVDKDNVDFLIAYPHGIRPWFRTASGQ